MSIFAKFNADTVKKVLASVEDPERIGYYESMGVTLDNCQTLESALKLSELDYEVKKLPLFHSGIENEYSFVQLPDYYSTVRSDTKKVLGVVGKGFQVLQNRDAFDFLDSMVAVGGAKFETAGSFKDGGVAYISMSTEPMKILGDTFDPYMMLMNGHDGSCAVRVVITPIRAICRNTAMLALKRATSSVSIKHTTNMNNRLEQAKEVLMANTAYMEALKKEAEALAVKTFSKEAFEKLAFTLYPQKEDKSEAVQIRNLYQIERLFKAYNENDLQNFGQSAWRAIQAVSDVESHPTAFKKTSKIANSGTPAMQVVIANMPLLNKALEIVRESV